MTAQKFAVTRKDRQEYYASLRRGAGKLELVLRALADVVARKLFGDMFQQVDTEAALLAAALGHAEPERKKILRGERLLLSQRVEHRIRRVAAEICNQLHRRMVFVACHRMRMEL